MAHSPDPIDPTATDHCIGRWLFYSAVAWSVVASARCGRAPERRQRQGFDSEALAGKPAAIQIADGNPMSRPELPDVFSIRDEQLPVVAHHDAEGPVEP